jgi:hypothetical protein
MERDERIYAEASRDSRGRGGGLLRVVQAVDIGGSPTFGRFLATDSLN